jgi:hypothetical protein
MEEVSFCLLITGDRYRFVTRCKSNSNRSFEMQPANCNKNGGSIILLFLVTGDCYRFVTRCKSNSSRSLKCSPQTAIPGPSCKKPGSDLGQRSSEVSYFTLWIRVVSDFQSSLTSPLLVPAPAAASMPQPDAPSVGAPASPLAQLLRPAAPRHRDLTKLWRGIDQGANI